MADPQRARKLGDRIKEIVADLLETRVKDPRLGFVTLTDVRVTGDLQNATIFYTVLGDDEDRAGTAAALESAKGMLRSAVGKEISIRLTPTLEFVADALPTTSAQMEALLRETAERDAAISRETAGATYAGDPDPYRKPHVDEELEEELD
jgi:ribosome-binding factor A